MDALKRAALAARTLQHRRDTRPLEYVSWLPLQHEFLSDAAKFKLLRHGNQTIGKTWAGLGEGIYHSLGWHPFYEVPPPPTVGAIVCPTSPQSLKIQSKLWELAPKDQVHPRTEFIKGRGFRGRYPHILWRNGSLTYVLTAGAGGLGLAGGTYDWLHVDEPPPDSRVFQELRSRVRRGNPGRMWMTFTPINAPIDYLRELTEQGQISEHWRPLSAAEMIPVGSTRPVRLGDGTICDAQWVQRLRLETVPHEIPVVVDGEWETRAQGNIFRSFKQTGPLSHVSTELPEGNVQLRLGIDHGSGANFSSTATLWWAQVPKRGKGHARVGILDEYVSAGETTEEDDALAIVEMLRRWNKTWSRTDLHSAVGDRPWQGRKTNERKDNARLMAAIERLLGIRPGLLDPQIKTAKTGPGRGGHKGVQVGCEFLHRSMVRVDHFRVHPRCSRFISALGMWSGRDDQWKHIIDTARYALDDLAFADHDRGRLEGLRIWSY